MGKPRDPIDIAIGVAIGARLRTLRKAAGLTQPVLAEKVGVTFQQIQKYENGIDRISAARLLRICIVLDLAVTDVLTDDVRAEAERQAS